MPTPNHKIVLYTIGHGEREIDDFVSLLINYQIPSLVDIRSHPRSKNNPQFSEQALRESLSQKNIVYHWAGRHLGGMRKLQSGNPHQSLTNDNEQAFAGYMDTDAFKQGVTQILNLVRNSAIALMCAEYLPGYCHRSLIADYLLLEGVSVKHIIDIDNIQDHQLNPYARRESLTLIYDRNTQNKNYE